tara:strand:+ start:41 stop:397 length:357 start_codon:yes stop_codon:yes gene_type:complete
MNVEEKIKRWVALDNKCRKYNDEIKILRDEKNLLSTNLINYFNGENMKFPNINISDGKLNLAEINVSNPISIKFLEKCLNEYFDNDTDSQDLLNFIKSKRIYNKNQYIRRVYNKQENE